MQRYLDRSQTSSTPDGWGHGPPRKVDEDPDLNLGPDLLILTKIVGGSMDTQDIKNAKDDVQRRASAARDFVEDKVDEIDPDGWFKRKFPDKRMRVRVVGLVLFVLFAIASFWLGQSDDDQAPESVIQGDQNAKP